MITLHFDPQPQYKYASVHNLNIIHSSSSSVLPTRLEIGIKGIRINLKNIYYFNSQCGLGLIWFWHPHQRKTTELLWLDLRLPVLDTKVLTARTLFILRFSSLRALSCTCPQDKMQNSLFHKPYGERSTDTNITHESTEALLCFPLGSSHYTLFGEKALNLKKRREDQRFSPPLELTKEQ